MNFLRKLITSSKKETPKDLSFKFGENKSKNLLCGIGEARIKKDSIEICNYPFEPSIAFPEKDIKANEIESLCIEFGVCKVFVGEDIIFVSAEKKEELKIFAEQNAIRLSKHSWNWDWILEPYLDTEFTKENEVRVSQRLMDNGIDEKEVNRLREEVGEQMFRYNFDTMLWDWCSLGLYDVLSAMRAKYDSIKFRDFYNRAIEIEKRNLTTP